MADPVNPRIVHLICSSGFYGAERVVANLTHAFPDFDMYILCMSPENADLAAFEQQIRVSPTCRFQRIPNQLSAAFRALRELYQSGNKLIIHAHGYKEVLTATLFKLRYRCPVVVTQHGFTARNLKSRFYNWIDKACCRWGGVQTVIAVSDAIASIYRQFGVAENRIIALQNGVTTSPPPDTNKQHQVLTELKLPEDTPVILFAGRLSEEKDPLLFVESMAALLEMYPDAKGVIAGDGPQAAKISEKISALKLNQHIHCMGFVNDIEGLIAAARIMVLTSKTEGIPMSMLEAMSAGTPVVAAAVGGIPSVIETGVNGVLVNSRQPAAFATACADLLSDSKKTEQLTDNARTTVTQRFSLESQKPVYQAIYNMEASA